MSPIGLITALAAGIALLWEDYKTWKEGGQSLIDWGKWKPEVDAALKMTRDLQTTVIDLTKALAKLLNIDPKSWSLKWDFSNFISQMGEFSKMLNMIADLLNAIKDGRWSEAASIGNQLLNQGSGNPSAMPMVTDSANSTAEWMKTRLGLILVAWDAQCAAGLAMMNQSSTASQLSDHSQPKRVLSCWAGCSRCLPIWSSYTGFRKDC